MCLQRDRPWSPQRFNLTAPQGLGPPAEVTGQAPTPHILGVLYKGRPSNPGLSPRSKEAGALGPLRDLWGAGTESRTVQGPPRKGAAREGLPVWAGGGGVSVRGAATRALSAANRRALLAAERGDTEPLSTARAESRGREPLCDRIGPGHMGASPLSAPRLADPPPSPASAPSPRPRVWCLRCLQGCPSPHAGLLLPLLL